MRQKNGNIFLNEIFLSGNLCDNTRVYSNGKFVTFSICQESQEMVKDEQGFITKHVTYFDISASEEIAEQFLDQAGNKAKGSLLKIDGYVKKSKSKKDGKYYTNIVMEKFEFLHKKLTEEGQIKEQLQALDDLHASNNLDDEIPF